MKVIKQNPKNWKVLRSPNGRYYDYDGYRNEDTEAVDNFIFKATLVPDSYYRGRSAAGFTFISGETSFTMRLNKVDELMQAIASGKVKVENGGFTGVFTFFKQGANYSIGLYND